VTAVMTKVTKVMKVSFGQSVDKAVNKKSAQVDKEEEFQL